MLIVHNVKAKATKIAFIVMVWATPSVVCVLVEDSWYVHHVMERELLQRVAMSVKERVKYIRLVMNVMARGVLENHFDTL